MNKLYQSALAIGCTGAYEIYEYMTMRCRESYTRIWDFIVGMEDER